MNYEYNTFFYYIVRGEEICYDGVFPTILFDVLYFSCVRVFYHFGKRVWKRKKKKNSYNDRKAKLHACPVREPGK